MLKCQSLAPHCFVDLFEICSGKTLLHSVNWDLRSLRLFIKPGVSLDGGRNDLGSLSLEILSSTFPPHREHFISNDDSSRTSIVASQIKHQYSALA